ncbi:MAG: nucleotidyltransferase family protein [Bryobacteraceae bacterium]
MSDIAVILLAAGNSTRMGCAKQLLHFRGKPLLRHAAETAIASGSRPVVVVLGAKAAELRPVLDGLPVRIAVNPDWNQGMGTSILTGLRALEFCSTEGAIITLADQPFVTSNTLDNLTRKHRESGKAIVAASYAGTVGVPVLFSRRAFPWLLKLRPQEGCKGVILNHPEHQILMDCPEAAIDIDTPGEYQALQTQQRHG